MSLLRRLPEHLQKGAGAPDTVGRSSQIQPFPLSYLQAPGSRSPFLPGDMRRTGMLLTPLEVVNGNVKQTGPNVSPCCSSPDTSPDSIPPHLLLSSV